MASSISGICFNTQKLTPKPTQISPSSSPSGFQRICVSFHQSKSSKFQVQSVAREVQSSTSKSTNDVVPKLSKNGHLLSKDPKALWQRYVDWLYQHKELGLYLDVSRVGFTDDFFQEMEPRLQKAFKDMVELEKGAIANPDEGRMVGHYWLRSPQLAPNTFLRLQIENTLEAVCQFADDVISGKVSLCFFYISPLFFPMIILPVYWISFFSRSNLCVSKFNFCSMNEESLFFRLHC